MTPHMVREAVDALHRAFEEFKAANDARLVDLETKGRADALLEEKVKGLNDQIEWAEKRVRLLETAAQRPFLTSTVSVPLGQEPFEKTAFFHYVRKGTEGLEQKALTSLSDASGGYLIPQSMVDKIHSTMIVTSPMRSLARVTSISTDALELLQEKGAADVGWVAETAERPETNTPELQRIRIPVHQIYAKPRASQKLLDDASVDIETWLAQKIAEKMTLTENAAFIMGDGKGKPQGFLVYDKAEVGKGEWGKLEAVSTQATKGLTESNILLEAYHALKAQYLRGAAWLMARSALAAIRKLKDGNGQYLWQPGMTEGVPATLFGCPVIIADDMPALEPKEPSTPIAFGNFREGYQIVDRAGLHLLRDPYSAKPYVEFYATKRVGGNVINFEAIKLIHFA